MTAEAGAASLFRRRDVLRLGCEDQIRMRAARILLVGAAVTVTGLTVRRPRVRLVAVSRLVYREHGNAPAFVMADGANLIPCQRLLRHRLLLRRILRCRNRSCEETCDPCNQTDDFLRVHRLFLPVRTNADDRIDQ